MVGHRVRHMVVHTLKTRLNDPAPIWSCGSRKVSALRGMSLQLACCHSSMAFRSEWAAMSAVDWSSAPVLGEVPRSWNQRSIATLSYECPSTVVTAAAQSHNDTIRQAEQATTQYDKQSRQRHNAMSRASNVAIR